ncbi:MAG: DUF481 domain-containing protein [Halioglobus sp.]
MKTNILITLAMLIISMTCLASPDNRKTDVVMLYNGDKVTGEIKQLFGGQLEISTNAMGTLKIDWQEISKIESIHHYEVRLVEGKRYYGTLGEPNRAGGLLVDDVYGEHDISTLEVSEIRPVAKSFKDRIDVYLALGYSYNNASSVGQTTLNTNIRYEDERTSNQLNGRLTITDSDQLITRSSKVDISRNVWTDRQDTYRIIMGGWEQNDELGLSHRLSLGTGLGRYFTDTQSSTWTGALGLQVLTEESLEGDRQESVEAVIGTEFSAWKFDTPELHIKLAGSVYPSLTESGRFRGDGDFKISWEIIEDLFFDITAFGTYDNKATEDSRFDYGISTGVGWTY